IRDKLVTGVQTCALPISYTTRAFDFYRAVVGYTWTTRRGTFVTLALLGQVSLSPGGTVINFLYGPFLSLAYRIAPSAKTAEAPRSEERRVGKECRGEWWP